MELKYFNKIKINLKRIKWLSHFSWIRTLSCTKPFVNFQSSERVNSFQQFFSLLLLRGRFSEVLAPPPWLISSSNINIQTLFFPHMPSAYSRFHLGKFYSSITICWINIAYWHNEVVFLLSAEAEFLGVFSFPERKHS